MMDQWIKWQETMISMQQQQLDAVKKTMAAQSGALSAMDANAKAMKSWMGMWGIK